VTRGALSAILATLVVAATIVAALITLGPPSVARAEHLDVLREQDLAAIEGALYAYHNHGDSLPASLEPLVIAHDLTRIPHDPSTNEPYTYTVTGPSAYSICATFQRPSNDEDSSLGTNHIYVGRSAFVTWRHGPWRHGAGHTCFDEKLPPSTH
jgi:hypothetical protein